MFMKVYVVSHGEYKEASSITSIHLDREDALKEIPMSLSQDRNGKHTPGVWWKNSVDYIEIEEHEVKCTAKQVGAIYHDLKLQEYMKNNITEAQITNIQEALDCDRDTAIAIIEDHAK
jgi:hypothetical protein